MPKEATTAEALHTAVTRARKTFLLVPGNRDDYYLELTREQAQELAAEADSCGFRGSINGTCVTLKRA